MKDFTLAEDVLRLHLVVSIVLCVKHGIPAAPATTSFAKSMRPNDTTWNGFGIGRIVFPMSAQPSPLGGMVCLGPKNAVNGANDRLVKGNSELIEKAPHIVDLFGGKIARADEARRMLRPEQSDVRNWHISEVPWRQLNVRFRGKSGPGGNLS